MGQRLEFRLDYGIVVLLASAIAGCGRTVAPPKAESPPLVFDAGTGYRDPVGNFKDDATANVVVAADAFPQNFVDDAGQPVDLTKYRGKKAIVLVFMRGYPGFICPNCTAQTSRLIRQYPEFTKRGAEILVVYPGPKDAIAGFVRQARREAGDAAVPFPLLIDPDFAAVDKLGIRADLAKPSTYILDKKGNVRYAYVGASTADRPSVKAMLDQVEKLSADAP